MRGLVLALLLAAHPAGAADGFVHYTNSHWGFELDIPDGHVGSAETATEDGQLFRGHKSEITVTGAMIEAADFEAQTAAQRLSDADAGWTIWFHYTMPRAASHGGEKGETQLWTGFIPVCGGKAFAEVRVTFPRSDAVKMQRPVSRMERSLHDTGTCEAN